jgi:hypothetical protein
VVALPFHFRKIIPVLVLAAFSSGCTAVPLPKSWKAVLRAWGVPIPLEAQFPEDQKPVPSDEEKRSRGHAEILSEVYQVVFQKEVSDSSWFMGFVGLLEQGATIEGVYNGWLREVNYRALENENRGAPAAVLEVFGKELALIESEAVKPKLFSRKDAFPQSWPERSAQDPEPIQIVESPQTTLGKPLGGGRYEEAKTGKIDVTGLATRYSETFVGANFFTLKRILGEEAIRLINEKLEMGRESLAQWYGSWVVQMANRGVDFGIPKRNEADFQFHRKWALDHSNDQVTWEVLNRLHRVMNESLKR